MKAARLVYRNRLLEVVLLGSVAVQIVSGVTLFVRGCKQRHGFVPWLQASSGVFLAFFLIIHVTSVLFGRAALHLDTNFYFASAGLHIAPFPFFFAPYYFLAVVALFTQTTPASSCWPRMTRAPKRHLPKLKPRSSENLNEQVALPNRFSPIASRRQHEFPDEPLVQLGR